MSKSPLAGCPFEDLVTKKLINVRFSDCGRYAMFKYSKKVFFDQLWAEDPRILDARGIVLRTTDWSIVVLPFRKVYNLGEQDAVYTAEEFGDTKLTWIEKVNGFMAAVTMVDGTLMVTTTGTFDSDFVKLAERRLAADGVLHVLRNMEPGVTFLFEICAKEDPHIVEEVEGCYLIGGRLHLGILMSDGSRHDTMHEDLLDKLAASFCSKGAKLFRPNWGVNTFSEILAKVRDPAYHGEGVMVRDGSGAHVFKLKSPYYLGLKLLSRATFFLKPDFDRRKMREKLEEEFYPLIDYIYDEVGVEAFKAMKDTDRVALLRARIES